MSATLVAFSRLFESACSESLSREARWMGCTFFPEVIDSEIAEEQQQHLLSLSQQQLSCAITQQDASDSTVMAMFFLTCGQNNLQTAIHDL